MRWTRPFSIRKSSARSSAGSAAPSSQSLRIGSSSTSRFPGCGADSCAHAGGSRFDVYSDTRSQVYRGKAAETATTNAAVAATAGQIVTYGGQPAITYFFASSGGMTEIVVNGFPGAEPEPWLKAVADPYEGPSSKWTVDLSFSTVAHRLKGLFKGAFRGIEVLKRGVSPRILLNTRVKCPW